MEAKKVWRVGVAGLGTVGAGLLQFLAERPDFAPGGARVVVTGVCARSRSRPRPIDISAIPWFDDPDAVMTGVETRTSSPVRIPRGADFQSLNTAGLYPAGEGAGYAGGIMSAAIDGVKVAEAVALNLCGAAV